MFDLQMKTELLKILVDPGLANRVRVKKSQFPIMMREQTLAIATTDRNYFTEEFA